MFRPALFFLCCALAPTLAAQGVSLVLGPASATPGTLVPVDLAIDTGDSSPAAVQWTIRYSSDAIVSIDVIPGPVANDAAKLLECNPAPGVIICLVYGLNRSTMASGLLVTLNVSLAADATGAIAVDLSDASAADASGGALATVATGGSIEVAPDSGPRINGGFPRRAPRW